jgi:uncharacterized protein (TIGR03000 family)
MRRDNDATRGRQWRRIVLGRSLILLALAGAGLPESHAQMRYNGGYITTHRHPEKFSSQPAAPQPPAPKLPPSYFPDNDFGYPSSYAEEGAVRPPSPLAIALPYGVSAAAFPWNQAGFEDYNEPPRVLQDSSLSTPKKYSLEVTTLPQAAPAAQPETAALIAHLPEDAVFWVEGTRTRSTGRTRYFQSPPLQLGHKYSYTVRVVWIEDSQWVSQTRMVPVRAGLIQAIYLRPSPAAQAKAAMNSLPK